MIMLRLLINIASSYRYKDILQGNVEYPYLTGAECNIK